MDEIVELSKSSADQADNIAEGIAKKLQHKSPIVKWKVGGLGTIRVPCDHASGEHEHAT